MSLLITTFKVVTLIFSFAAVWTGLQALLTPCEFSQSFGLPIRTTKSSSATTSQETLTASYVSLMGVRQLATGLILLTFAYQQKWEEVATILAIIGVLVAGTDGWALASNGNTGKGFFHAVPGLAIAALAGSVVYVGV